MPIGPSLPPGFSTNASSSDEDDKQVGPSMPPHHKSQVGPSLPSQKKHRVGPTMPGPALPQNDSDDEYCGPSLPPSLRLAAGPPAGNPDSSDDDMAGPALPPGMRAGGAGDSDEDFGPTVQTGVIKGPTMPPANMQYSESSESEEEMVGPMPPSQMTEEEQTRFVLDEFQRREERMKLKLSGVDVDGEHKLEREEWMTELPNLRQGNQVIGATTFRKNGVAAAEAGRSEWTKTPNAGKANMNTRERKVDEQKAIDYIASMEKNKKEEKALRALKRNNESLMATHSKKMDKKEKEAKNLPGYKKERVAFDKIKDMQGSIIDDAKRKALLRKTAGLGGDNGRFASGHSKFL